MNRHQVTNRLYGVLPYLTVGIILATIVLPLLYVLSISLRPSNQIFGETVNWIPQTFTLDNYVTAYSMLEGYMINSLIIASGTAILSLIVAIPGAYAFGRKDFPGKRIIFYLIILSLLFPHVMLVAPVGGLWRDLGLYNSYVGMWFAYQILVTPWALWILRDFFSSLPSNLEEAAEVYGCSKLSAVWRVIVPLSTPAIVAVGFLSFLTGWNDFLFANILTSGTGVRPAVVHIFILVLDTEGIPWSLVTAQAIIVGGPPFALYLFAQRYLSEAFAMS